MMAFAVTAYPQAVEGVLTGTIYDASGDAVMPGVKVEIRIAGKTETTISDQNGAYYFRVPPGTYDLLASSNWLYPLKRSPIIVSKNARLTINLYPSFRVKTQSLVATRKGVIDEYSYWPVSRYETIVSEQGNAYLIEFKRASTRRKIRTFGSTSFERVKITHDALTVLGREVIIDGKGQIKVVGNVLIDQGGERTRSETHILP